MKIAIRELEELTARAIAAYGYDEAEVQAISDVLLYAQLRGNNQGIVKLIGKGIPKHLQAGEIRVEKETPLSVRIDGSQNHAMVVVSRAVDIVIAKAQAMGFGLAGVSNTSTSSGAIGYFASQMAKRGLIGFVFARSPERVAAHGSYEPVFGTNPLAIAIPAAPDPIVLDMSTAAISFYGLLEAKTAGRSIADDLAYDAGGMPTSDAEAAIGGAIRSFDRGHKGSSLGLIGEILAGPMVGAAFCGLGDSKGNWGHLLYAIDPELLTDRNEFMAEVGRIVERVKSTRPLEGVDEIFVPGERGNALTRKRLAAGEIDIEDNLLAQLRAVAAQAEK
ncbi:MAG: Ldh family oxidoreductase [Syntrophotaleaceae bacterium]